MHVLAMASTFHCRANSTGCRQLRRFYASGQWPVANAGAHHFRRMGEIPVCDHPSHPRSEQDFTQNKERHKSGVLCRRSTEHTHMHVSTHTMCTIQFAKSMDYVLHTISIFFCEIKLFNKISLIHAVISSKSYKPAIV